MNRINKGYEVPKLATPFPVITEKRRQDRYWFYSDGNNPVAAFNISEPSAEHIPYEWGYAGLSPEEIRRDSRRRHTIGLLQVIAVIVSLILLFVVGSAFFSQAHAESESCFPRYWEMDSYWTKQVQSRLVDLGYDISIDGQFGPKTAEAVKNFQYDHGLTVTGVVDQAAAEELGFELESGRTLYYMADLAKIANESKDYLIYVALGGRSGISHIGVFHKQEGNWELIKSEDCLLGEQTKVFLGKTSVTKKTGLRTKISEEGYVYAYRNVLDLKNASSSAICSFPQLGKEWDKTQAYPGYIHVSPELSSWLNENIPIGSIVVIDDRAWQPSNL